MEPDAYSPAEKRGSRSLRSGTFFQSGFSLVETVLALGVVSFALVAVIGLLPTGLHSMRQAMDMNVEARIVSHISSEALLTPFSGLNTAFSQKAFYFDADGIAMENSGNTVPAGAKYVVNTSVVDPAYPSSDSLSQDAVRESLRRLELDFKIMGASSTSSSKQKFYYLEIANSGN